MQRHFVMTPLGYLKPKVLPFAGIIEQHFVETEGYGRVDYRDIVKPGLVKNIYSQDS